MQKAFYPVFSPSLSNHGAVNNESRALSSIASSEIQIINNSYKGAFLMNTEHCDGFQLTGFSHLDQKMPKQTPTFSFSMTPVNGGGGGGATKATVVTSSRTVNLVACYPTVMPGSMGDHTSKKQKTCSQVEMLHSPSFVTESSLVQSQSSSRRSQKLGDKITALQQLVSPFGKTDTASVLHEATVCIKILHEQLRVLASPYFQSKSSAYQRDYQEKQESLHSRGLCLVPVSNVINFNDRHAAFNHSRNETTPWTHLT